MCHTKFPVDDVYGATSPYTSCTSGIKVAANPIPGSPFASPVAGDLSTPLSQLSHCNSLSWAFTGHP